MAFSRSSATSAFVASRFPVSVLFAVALKKSFLRFLKLVQRVFEYCTRPKQSSKIYIRNPQFKCAPLQMALQSAVENVARFSRLPRTCSGCDMKFQLIVLMGSLQKLNCRNCGNRDRPIML